MLGDAPKGAAIQISLDPERHPGIAVEVLVVLERYGVEPTNLSLLGNLGNVEMAAVKAGGPGKGTVDRPVLPVASVRHGAVLGGAANATTVWLEVHRFRCDSAGSSRRENPGSGSPPARLADRRSPHCAGTG